MKRFSIFVDSSVLVAAMLSSSGGSFRLCREANEGLLRIVSNQYVEEEVREVLRRKYPLKALQADEFLSWTKIYIHNKPPVYLVKKLTGCIATKDAPVLAGAVQAKSKFLVTLDQKDFFTNKVKTAGLRFIIVTPKMFFQEYWETGN